MNLDGEASKLLVVIQRAQPVQPFEVIFLEGRLGGQVEIARPARPRTALPRVLSSRIREAGETAVTSSGNRSRLARPRSSSAFDFVKSQLYERTIPGRRTVPRYPPLLGRKNSISSRMSPRANSSGRTVGRKTRSGG